VCEAGVDAGGGGGGAAAGDAVVASFCCASGSYHVIRIELRGRTKQSINQSITLNCTRAEMMTDLSFLGPCCLLDFLLRDEITSAAAPNAPKYVRHVGFLLFFFSNSRSYNNEGNDSGPLSKFDADVLRWD
jgi:hypothetical protein